MDGYYGLTNLRHIGVEYYIAKYSNLKGSPKMAWGRFRTFYLWPFRLSVRTLGFHPKKTGSIPVGATIDV